MAARTIAQPDVRFARVADGVVAQIINRTVLPPTLDILLSRLMLTSEHPVFLRGPRRACTDGEHDLRDWSSGIWRAAPVAVTATAHQGLVRLELRMCPYCGVVEVRDTSFNRLAGVSAGSGPMLRKSDVLGWYAGKRASGRTYL